MTRTGPRGGPVLLLDGCAAFSLELPVAWAVEEGITNGTTETTFNPLGQCQRAQAVTFLYRTFA